MSCEGDGRIFVRSGFIVKSRESKVLELGGEVVQAVEGEAVSRLGVLVVWQAVRCIPSMARPHGAASCWHSASRLGWPGHHQIIQYVA